MSTIGTFILIKNEAEWVGASTLRVLPYVDEMVFFDGNSTDGTIEILDEIARTQKGGEKIRIYEDEDPKDLRDDYVRVFNQCLHALSTDWAWFLHPDMFVVNPEDIRKSLDNPAQAMTTRLTSFAGEPGGQTLKIVDGRCDRWKNIYRLRNPDMGAHYHGHYGAQNEDVYFSEITGDSHIFNGNRFDLYPYEVADSGIHSMHFSDVRSYDRRVGRMKACLENQGYSAEEADIIAPSHARVSLKSGMGFHFKPVTECQEIEYYMDFLRLNSKFEHIRNICLMGPASEPIPSVLAPLAVKTKGV